MTKILNRTRALVPATVALGGSTLFTATAEAGVWIDGYYCYINPYWGWVCI